MYIIELIEKFLKAAQQREQEEKNNVADGIENEKCEHIFVPTDSTGNILACNKCGLTVKKSKLIRKNFFKK